MKQTFFLITLLFLLLFFHNDVIMGARTGLLLWYQTLLPSLFPFIIITNALWETNSYRYLIQAFTPLFRQKSGEFVVFMLGNLCGYPVGGKILEQFYHANQISLYEKEKLLPYVNQTSPMFIIGYIFPCILEKQIPLAVFLLSIYIPTIVGFLFTVYGRDDGSFRLPNKENKLNITNTFIEAVKTIVLIGVYIMIFSIIYKISLPFCHSLYLQIILSFLEITTGLTVLKEALQNNCLYLPVIGMLTAFGGLCSIYQIKCVAHMNTKKYLRTKLLLSTGTFLFLFIYQIF